MFSLTHKSKHPVIKADKAILVRKDLLAAFGPDCDLYAYEDCNTKKDNPGGSWLFGECYELPKGIAAKSDYANKYLGGAQKFKIKEIDVY